MIRHASLNLAFDQLQRKYEALADLRASVLPRYPRLFALMAEGTLAQILDLHQQIDVESGVNEARRFDADVWLKAEGPEVTCPEMRSSALTAMLDSLRKGIQNVAEHLPGLGPSGCRAVEALKPACDFEVVALQPGSLAVGLRLPTALRRADAVNLSNVRQALRDYIYAASWIGSEEGIEKLDAHFKDESYRKLLLVEIKRICPRQKGAIESIQMFGRAVAMAGNTEIRLTRQSSWRIQRALYRDIQNPPREYEGRVREIDLDAFTFTLRKPDQPESVRCSYSDEFRETVKESLDKFVTVSGLLKTDRSRMTIEITNLEIVEERDDQAPAEACG